MESFDLKHHEKKDNCEKVKKNETSGILYQEQNPNLDLLGVLSISVRR